MRLQKRYPPAARRLQPPAQALTPRATPDMALPPLTEDQRGAIKQWFAASDTEPQAVHHALEKAISKPTPRRRKTQVQDRETYEVNTNVDFRQAEQKKAQLWFDTAQVQLSPIEPLSEIGTGLDAAA